MADGPGPPRQGHVRPAVVPAPGPGGGSGDGALGAMLVVVTGDVVGSRRFLERGRLLAGLDSALAAVEAAEPGSERLRRTHDDVFLGAYGDLGAAATAALRLRLATDELVLPTIDGVDEPVELRLGLGIGDEPAGAAAAGPVGVPGPSGVAVAVERARQALAEAEELAASRTWPDSLRSRCRAATPVLAAAVNAHLLLQDQLLARLDARDRRALLGLLDGERQVDVARVLGVTQPAIARRLRARGSLALHQAVLELRRATGSGDSGAPGI